MNYYKKENLYRIMLTLAKTNSNCVYIVGDRGGGEDNIAPLKQKLLIWFCLTVICWNSFQDLHFELKEKTNNTQKENEIPFKTHFLHKRIMGKILLPCRM